MPRAQNRRGNMHRAGNRGRHRPRPVPGMQKNSQTKAEDITLESCKSKPELLFTTSASFDIHHSFQEEDCLLYTATLLMLIEVGVEVTAGSKAKTLSAAWARKDFALANRLLALKSQFGLVEILKALHILDSGRKVREWEKKLQHLQMRSDKPRRCKVGKIKSNIDSLKNLQPKVGSVSGALVRHIKKWVQRQPASELEFYALHYPKQPWKEVANLCHLHPEKDFQLSWFLSYCFDQPAPVDTMVFHCSTINSANINELVTSYEIPYSHIKSLCKDLTTESMLRIAKYTPDVDTLLWNYEDLQCPKVDDVITERLKGGEKVNLSYGKLMERLLTFALLQKAKRGKRRVDSVLNLVGGNSKSVANFASLLIPQAEEGLKKISIHLEAPVAVIGDRSPSMGVAIRTSTIIASIMASVTNATLSFFSSCDYVLDKIPVTVEEVLHLATTLQTDGATAPAASLWPYYEQKKIVKTFVMVTDEEENTKHQNYMFMPLFKKYHAEVYPAKLVFVSFLHGQHANGQMVSSLKQEGFTPLQFKFDKNRPDLTKLDSMLGLMTLETEDFRNAVSRKKEELIAKV